LLAATAIVVEAATKHKAAMRVIRVFFIFTPLR
jgi:hypothetical protein